MSNYLLLNIDYVNHIQATLQYIKINKLRITRFMQYFIWIPTRHKSNTEVIIVKLM